MTPAMEGTRIACAECQVERDATGLDSIWCSSDECYVLVFEDPDDEDGLNTGRGVISCSYAVRPGNRPGAATTRTIL